MLLHTNNTVDIFRGKTKADMGIDVYIYEQSDTQDAMSGVEWAQNELRLLTVYTDIRNRDRLVDTTGRVYVVKKVKTRTSLLDTFLEVQVRQEND
jgi:hypothetical protein